MPTIRRAAARLLRVAVQHCSEPSRSWGTAMLREMDFVNGDWAALRWALGSAAAIGRHSLIHKLSGWRGRWIPSVLSGMAVASMVLTISVAALFALTRTSWFEPNPGTLAELTFFVGIPETVYLLAAVALWRPQRRVACGILAVGAILITHSILHFMT
jgi:hypothetical protein